MMKLIYINKGCKYLFTCFILNVLLNITNSEMSWFFFIN